MNNGSENLDQLLRQFMDERHARQLRDDLSFSDGLFEQYPVQSLNQKTIDAVAHRVHRKLNHQRYWITAKWCTATAAVAVLALMAGLFTLYPPSGPASQSGGEPSVKIVTASQDKLWTDTLYAVALETDPIEQEMAELTESIQLETSSDTYEPINTMTLDLLEIEEIELLADNTNFWKG